MSGSRNRTRTTAITVLAIVLPLLLFVLSLNLGTYRIPPKDVLPILTRAVFSAGGGESSPAADVLIRIRLPRLLLALFAGAALAVSGASLQALFRNPLVFEFSLGISYGAAFGAALSLVFLGAKVPAQAAAFVFAVAAVLAVLFVAGRAASQVVTILLSGVIVSALFQALLSLVEFFANPYALQALIFWLMGSLGQATWTDLAISLPLIGLGVAALIGLRWRLNVLSLGEDEARTLGIDVRREKVLVIILAALTTAAATAVTGVISWIGLIVPHLVRMAVGPDNRKVIPLSAAFGASLLLLADDIARSAFAFEIPIGILTSVVGIPFFIVLLKRSGKVWL
ncbi:MAG: iron ABC transporter permease [Candidatus Aminicenantes bacterium]|nr:iron ABC transporter permease [Candidatus Aminicenantes bacterium]